MKKIVILGSTGSIGTQALDVIKNLPANGYKVVGLSAYSNIGLLKRQLSRFLPQIAAVWKKNDCDALKQWCRSSRIKTRIVWGLEGLLKTARFQGANFVLSAVVGSAGIWPLFEAIKAGKQIALANKEALVIAGSLVMKAARKAKVSIIPVDSEHSGIFQCLKNEQNRFVKKIILTASGGPFYRRGGDSRKKITVQNALAHPTWKMGKKVSIDSATLMNKGLEAIEASRLFGVPLDKIEIVIHPQSIVHSLVQFIDGSVIAQLSNPDMRLPIQYALTYPERKPSRIKELSLPKIKNLEFDKPDFGRFPCLELAIKAGKTGGTMPAAMNAANEAAVAGFLKNEISFGQIPKIVKRVMDTHRNTKDPSLDQIIEADLTARKAVYKYIERIKG